MAKTKPQAKQKAEVVPPGLTRKDFLLAWDLMRLAKERKAGCGSPEA
jgi:hypothetical protein